MASEDVFVGLPGIFREAVLQEHDFSVPWIESVKRYDLSTPWVAGAHVHAADGRIAVWSPLATLDRDTIRRLEATANKQRPHMGPYTTRPSWFGGPGEARLDIPDVGSMPDTTPVEVADKVLLSSRYLAILRRHGAALVLPVGPRERDWTSAVHFLGYGFAGIVMPMRRPSPRFDIASVN